MQHHSHSVSDTMRIAESFIISHIETNPLYPIVLALFGELGSGKTIFSKGIAKALGITIPVTSPTFAILNDYFIDTSVWSLVHLDLYRISSIDELYEIGFEDYLNRNRTVIAIEWAERIEADLPKGTIKVRFQWSPGSDEPEEERMIIIDAT